MILRTDDIDTRRETADNECAHRIINVKYYTQNLVVLRISVYLRMVVMLGFALTKMQSTLDCTVLLKEKEG